MRTHRAIVAAALALGLAAAAGPAESRRISPGAAPSTARGKVVGRVAVRAEGKPRSDHSGVVITLEGVPGDVVEPGRAQMRQHRRAFVPALVVVTRGSTVDFPNDDKIFHNVFSLSRAARFDLGLYKSGTSKSVTLHRAGVVDVHCNIHSEMTAKIKVVDTSYHAITGQDGTFRIDRIPPGTYSIVAWQPHGEEYRGEITIEPGRTAAIAIELDQGKAARRHLRKDGTPYGRYR
jgi:plastocyanin